MCAERSESIPIQPSKSTEICFFSLFLCHTSDRYSRIVPKTGLKSALAFGCFSTAYTALAIPGDLHLP